MIWGAYPTAKDVVPQGKMTLLGIAAVAALQEAVVYIEDRVGHPLILVEKVALVRLRKGWSVLPEYPVVGVRLEDEKGKLCSEKEFMVDEVRGAVLSELEGDHRVLFWTGFEKGKLPSTLQLIVLHEARYSLLGDMAQRQEVEDLLEAWWVIRKRLEKERDGLDKIGGNVRSEGLL